MQNLTNLLIRKKKLAYLQNQLALQEHLLKQVRECLPSPLDQHCTGAIPRGEVLTLLVKTSAWASRLRYLGRDLLAQLQRRQIRFKRLHIKVSVEARLGKPSSTSRRATPLSRENAELLRSLGESQDDDQLKSALQRLSRHTIG